MAYEAEKRVILSHQELVERVRSRVESYATRVWNGMGSWRDDDIDAFVAKVVPVVENGQKQIAQLTGAYLDSVARLAGMPTPPKATLPANLRGVPLADVYRRPAVAVYTALSEGRPIDEAVQLGAQRITSLVNMDMQMANVRMAYERISKDDRIVGYERVLSGGENCALCAIASTQRYHSGDLMPIHDNCNCDVVPIYGQSDVGQVINEERLFDVQDQLKAQGVEYEGGQFKSDRSIRVNVHGEYGPVLGWADQNFTSESDL